ncbi:hypothetical protein Fmac_030124 [Flemingia macrophylla]|uniref:Uncharacterized protein n=1 Tax=Flemingia macrophylla TaxID=520843 RepID=A0ABD1LDX2_9FABA
MTFCLYPFLGFFSLFWCTPLGFNNMEMVAFVPVCGNMKKHRRKGAYHKLKGVTDQVSEYSTTSDEKVLPKIRLSINLWKRLRDAYVQRMHSLAEHVAHMNNGEICFLRKIHDDDDVQLLIASSNLDF